LGVTAWVCRKLALRVSVRKTSLASYDSDAVRNGRFSVTLANVPVRPPLAVRIV